MKIIIFHGWGSTSKDNWFPWLKNELKGFEVFVPDLPHTVNPNQKEWLETALNFEYDENTILVGHSLGCILILRLLEKFKVRAAFLVSGFDNTLGINELKSFFKQDFDYEKIKKNKIYMLSSDNDPYIPLTVAKRLSKTLDCGLITFHNKGHLSAGTDKFKFPELKEMILDEAKK